VGEGELAQVQGVAALVVVDAVTDRMNFSMLSGEVSQSASYSPSTLCTGTRTLGTSWGSFSAAQRGAAISSTAGAGE
jgi:hypothetical protein